MTTTTETPKPPLPTMADCQRLTDFLPGKPGVELDPADQETALGRTLAEVLTTANGTGRPEAMKRYLRTYAGEHGDAAAETLRRMVFKAEPGAHAAIAPQHEWTHRSLMAASFEPLEWVVDEFVLAEGLTGLGAKKKMGKSWMCLQIAQAVAAGKPVFGRKTKQGSVIYICLEDGARRLRQRLGLQKARADLDITYITRWRPLDKGGLEDLATLIRERSPRLVIIDTLAAAKSGKIDENDAGPMADLFNSLHDLAIDQSVGILVVAHHGKNVTGDPGQDFRGSSAIGAGVDLSIALYKTEAGHVLKAEGRDIGEAELRIEFDAIETWTWSVKGDARVLARDEADQEVTDALRRLGKVDAGTVARETGKSRVAARKNLERLRQGGLVKDEVVKEGRVTRVLFELAQGKPDGR